MTQTSKAELTYELEMLKASLFHIGNSIEKNESSSIIISNQDLNLRYQWVFSTHSAIQAEFFEGKTDLELDSFAHAAHITELKKKVIQYGKPIRHLTQFNTGTEVIELDLSAIPLYNTNGKIIGVTSVAVDVSKFKLIHSILTEAQDQIDNNVISRIKHLQVMDDELMNMTQLLPFVFCTCKADGSYATTFISANVKDVTGYEPENFLKHTSFWVDHIHPDDKSTTLSSISNLFDNDCQKLIYRFKVADGTYRWLRNILHLVEYSNKPDDRRIVGVFHDITEQKLNYEELITIKKQAEDAIQIKTQFLSRMSHELRTPLNSILGYAQLLREVLPDHSKVLTRHLDNILKSGWHMLQIVSDILDFSMMENSKIELYKEDYELKILIADCLDTVAPMANEKNITIKCKIDEFENQFVYVDPARLKQVLMNLLSNAIKYNTNNGTINVYLKPRENNLLRINIVDSGNGIAAKDIPELFKPFSQLYLNTYAIDGTGIGLAVSKKLVELMDGMIGVDTQLNKGSCFFVEFKKQNISRPNKSESTFVARENSEISNESTVLYIEDSPSHIRLVEEILCNTPNIKLISAMNSRIGLDLARLNQPDLILLDICLPDMDGFSILQNLQNDKRTRSIPVLALSANALPSEIDNAIKMGFTRYLTKPINVIDFKNTILELLSSKN